MGLCMAPYCPHHQVRGIPRQGCLNQEAKVSGSSSIGQPCSSLAEPQKFDFDLPDRVQMRLGSSRWESLRSRIEGAFRRGVTSCRVACLVDTMIYGCPG